MCLTCLRDPPALIAHAAPAAPAARAAQVAGVIVGARNAAHVADHQRVCSLELDAEDLAQIQAGTSCCSWDRELLPAQCAHCMRGCMWLHLHMHWAKVSDVQSGEGEGMRH